MEYRRLLGIFRPITERELGRQKFWGFTEFPRVQSVTTWEENICDQGKKSPERARRNEYWSSQKAYGNSFCFTYPEWKISHHRASENSEVGINRFLIKHTGLPEKPERKKKIVKNKMVSRGLTISPSKTHTHKIYSFSFFFCFSRKCFSV